MAIICFFAAEPPNDTLTVKDNCEISKVIFPVEKDSPVKIEKTESSVKVENTEKEAAKKFHTPVLGQLPDLIDGMTINYTIV